MEIGVQQGTVELTGDNRRAFAGAAQKPGGLWFVCSGCNNLHQWRGGPFRCYDTDDREDTPIAASVVCKCGDGFCPAHGK